ncbi:MAG: dimethylsulfonioproprionate lyase family protein, partial [Pseudomonadota bacterium]
ARHDTPPARLGLFLLAPGLHYPIHQHEAIEVYYCASGNLELQHGTKGAPFTLEPGMFSVTPSNRLHALTTGAAPCLLIYAWCGNVTAPAWWWEEEADGTWSRVKWVRRDDGRWVIAAREPVNAAILAEAGEG